MMKEYKNELPADDEMRYVEISAMLPADSTFHHIFFFSFCFFSY